MRFIGNIETTVGQVVKDLEAIAKNHPDDVLRFPLVCTSFFDGLIIPDDCENVNSKNRK